MGNEWRGSQPPPRTTFERLLPQAYAGDAETQNFLGFMFFHGESVERDLEIAHVFFHLAAEQGHQGAQRNLAAMHSGSLPSVPFDFVDPAEAADWFRLAETAADASYCAGSDCADYRQESTPSPDSSRIGRSTYATFCAGCHAGIGSLQQVGPRANAGQSKSLPAVHQRISDAIGPALFDAALVRMTDESGARETSRRPGSAPIPLDGLAAHEGKSLFRTFCSGCHGFNGISYFVSSPSFALGERLEKTDGELLRSIAYGLGAMPGWGGKLSDGQIRRVLAYVRGLRARYEWGIAISLEPPPSEFFLFRPSQESDPWSEPPLPAHGAP